MGNLVLLLGKSGQNPTRKSLNTEKIRSLDSQESAGTWSRRRRHRSNGMDARCQWRWHPCYCCKFVAINLPLLALTFYLKFAEVLDYFLSSGHPTDVEADAEKKRLWSEIQDLAVQDSDIADSKLEKYFMEALRLTSQQQICRRTVKESLVANHTLKPDQDVILLIVRPPILHMKTLLIQISPKRTKTPQPLATRRNFLSIENPLTTSTSITGQQGL